MFKFYSQDEITSLKQEIADLQRELVFEKRERESDADRAKMKASLEDLIKRWEHSEARLIAEAKQQSSDDRAATATAFADKAEKLAARCAADFGQAVGKMQESFLACLKELKPVEPKLTVLPQTINQDCRKEGASIKMS